MYIMTWGGCLISTCRFNFSLNRCFYLQKSWTTSVEAGPRCKYGVGATLQREQDGFRLRRPEEGCSHHRDHGAGRVLPGGVPSREGIRGPRDHSEKFVFQHGTDSSSLRWSELTQTGRIKILSYLFLLRINQPYFDIQYVNYMPIQLIQIVEVRISWIFC